MAKAPKGMPTVDPNLPTGWRAPRPLKKIHARVMGVRHRTGVTVVDYDNTPHMLANLHVMKFAAARRAAWAMRNSAVEVWNMNASMIPEGGGRGTPWKLAESTPERKMARGAPRPDKPLGESMSLIEHGLVADVEFIQGQPTAVLRFSKEMHRGTLGREGGMTYEDLGRLLEFGWITDEGEFVEGFAWLTKSALWLQKRGYSKEMNQVMQTMGGYFDAHNSIR